MPRDKTESHKRITEIAKKEFLEKGFEGTSMRDIASQVGMSQSALYKHYESKEAMFNGLLDPFVEKLVEAGNEHEKRAYENFSKNKCSESMVTDNLVEIVKDLMINYPDELRLIICKSHGTKYETFIEDLVKYATKNFFKALNYLKDNGATFEEINEDELYVLLGAYYKAVIEPIKKGWSREKAFRCLDRVEKFFIPAWKKLMGL